MAVQLSPQTETEYRLETADDLTPLIEAIGDAR